MSEQHTPGPWYAAREATTGRITRVRASHSGGRDEVCIADAAQGAGAFARLEANARLIAAAPELLEACQTLATLLDTDDWFATGRLAVEQARAAIAKATGRAA